MFCFFKIDSSKNCWALEQRYRTVSSNCGIFLGGDGGIHDFESICTRFIKCCQHTPGGCFNKWIGSLVFLFINLFSEPTTMVEAELLSLPTKVAAQT